MQRIKSVNKLRGILSCVGALFTATLAQQAQAQLLIGTKIDVGWEHSCAIESGSNKLHCWGSNFSDQLNLQGVTTPPFLSYNYAKLTNNAAGSVVGLDLGGHRTCVKEAGTGALKCWGVNLFGSTGNSVQAPASTGSTFNPYAAGMGGDKQMPAVSFPSAFTFGAAGMGNEHSCVVGTATYDGQVWCWGLNSYNQQNYSTTPPTQSAQLGFATGLMTYNSVFQRYGTHLPGRVVGGALTPTTKMSKVSGTAHTTCSIESSPNAGQVWCWGEFGTGGNIFSPLRAKKQVGTVDFTDAKQIKSSKTQTCVIDSANKVFCANHHVDGSVFKQIAGLPPIQKVAPGWQHGCALDVSGKVWCWGNSAYGVLGSSASGSNVSPTIIPTISSIVEITSYFGHTCARKTTGELYCWGRNELGQLGTCSTASSVNIPTPVVKSCVPPAQPVNAACGSSSGGSFPNSPTTNLCNLGNPPSVLTPITSGGQVTGWSWTCTGINGGANSPLCAASAVGVPAPGKCGSADMSNGGAGFVSSFIPPSNQLCATGSPASPVSSGGVWTWSCSGSPAAICSARDNSPPPLPQCGTAHMGTYPWNNAPAVGTLCAPPNVPSALTPPNLQNTFLPNTYQWTCSNSLGQSIACLAKRIQPQIQTVTVTPVKGPFCTSSPAGAVTIAAGGTASFTLGTSGGGYVVSSVTSSCGGTTVGNVFTTAPTSTNCTVSVTCAPCQGQGCQTN